MIGIFRYPIYSLYDSGAVTGLRGPLGFAIVLCAIPAHNPLYADRSSRTYQNHRQWRRISHSLLTDLYDIYFPIPTR